MKVAIPHFRGIIIRQESDLLHVAWQIHKNTFEGRRELARCRSPSQWVERRAERAGTSDRSGKIVDVCERIQSIRAPSSNGTETCAEEISPFASAIETAQRALQNLFWNDKWPLYGLKHDPALGCRGRS